MESPNSEKVLELIEQLKESPEKEEEILNNINAIVTESYLKVLNATLINRLCLTDEKHQEKQ